MGTGDISLETMVAYVEAETERWREWFAGAPPGVLDLSLGGGGEGTVRTLVKHIFAVELRYAQRLEGQPVTGYDQLDDRSVEALWRIHRTAVSIRSRFLARVRGEEWGRVLVSETRRLGRLESTVHDVVIHTLLHGVRHWAQVATVLRQHGHGGLWEHDWLVSPAVTRRSLSVPPAAAG